MDFLALFIVASAIGAGLVAWVILWTTNRSAEAAITRHFRASETILETGKPPPEWHAPPAWKRLLALGKKPASDDPCLARLDELIRFFEGCSFYEDDFAREQHLRQLEDLRESWRANAAR